MGRQGGLQAQSVKGMAVLFTWGEGKVNFYQKVSKAWLLFSHDGEGKGNFWERCPRQPALGNGGEGKENFWQKVQNMAAHLYGDKFMGNFRAFLVGGG
jgi:hypothetical protein